MPATCLELMNQIGNIKRVRNNLNQMIDVFSSFKYNAASRAEIKSRQLGDIFKFKENLKSLIEHANLELGNTEENVRWRTAI